MKNFATKQCYIFLAGLLFTLLLLAQISAGRQNGEIELSKEPEKLKVPEEPKIPKKPEISKKPEIPTKSKITEEQKIPEESVYKNGVELVNKNKNENILNFFKENFIRHKQFAKQDEKVKWHDGLGSTEILVFAFSVNA